MQGTQRICMSTCLYQSGAPVVARDLTVVRRKREALGRRASATFGSHSRVERAEPRSSLAGPPSAIFLWLEPAGPPRRRDTAR
jgi:hypothetical protein